MFEAYRHGITVGGRRTYTNVELAIGQQAIEHGTDTRIVRNRVAPSVLAAISTRNIRIRMHAPPRRLVAHHVTRTFASTRAIEDTLASLTLSNSRAGGRNRAVTGFDTIRRTYRQFEFGRAGRVFVQASRVRARALVTVEIIHRACLGRHTLAWPRAPAARPRRLPRGARAPGTIAFVPPRPGRRARRRHGRSTVLTGQKDRSS